MNKQHFPSLRLLVSFLLMGVVLLGHPAGVTAAGTEFFVSPSGSGTDCSQDNPCAAAQAIALASTGDVIYFEGGSYPVSGSETLFTLTKALSLYSGWDGADSGPIVLDPVGNPSSFNGGAALRFLLIQTNDAINLTVINGFSFFNGRSSTPSSPDNGGAILVASGSVLIEDCYFNNNKADDNGGAIYVMAHSIATIQRNVFADNDAGGLGGAIYAGPTSPPAAGLVQIVGNYFGNTIDGPSSVKGGFLAAKDVAITINQNDLRDSRGSSAVLIDSMGPLATITNNFISWSDNAAIDVTGVSTLPHKIVNNTIVSSGAIGISVASGAKAAITNNIISHTPTDSISATGANLMGSHNLFYLNGDDPFPLDNPITGQDPDYVDAFMENYHINENSPAEDAGAAVSLSVDFDNEVRPSGGGYDIGADEIMRVNYQFIPLICLSQ